MSSLILTGDGLGNIIRWNTSTGITLKSLSFAHPFKLGKEIDRVNEPNNEILTMDFNYNGSYLATAGKDSTVFINEL